VDQNKVQHHHFILQQVLHIVSEHFNLLFIKLNKNTSGPTSPSYSPNRSYSPTSPTYSVKSPSLNNPIGINQPNIHTSPKYSPTRLKKKIIYKIKYLNN
jgi:hypothetical protein